MVFFTGWLIYCLTFYRMPKYEMAFFRVAFVGWPISRRLFPGKAFLRMVFFRMALCLDGIFPSSFLPGGFVGWLIS